MPSLSEADGAGVAIVVVRRNWRYKTRSHDRSLPTKRGGCRGVFKVRDDALNAGEIIAKARKVHIATHAKKSTNHSRGVTVVNMQALIFLGFILTLAERALCALKGKQDVELAFGDTPPPKTISITPCQCRVPAVYCLSARI